MKKWLLSIIIFCPSALFSQTANFDTAVFNLYSNLNEGISFIYPKNWELTNADPRLIFRATEALQNSEDTYRETFYLIKQYRIRNLRSLLNDLCRTIRSRNRKQISIISKEIKENQNGVQYGILINKANQDTLVGIKTHVYFNLGDSAYSLIFENDLLKSEKYDFLYSEVIRSIQKIPVIKEGD